MGTMRAVPLRRLLAISAAGALALAPVACSGDDEGGSGGGASPTTGAGHDTGTIVVTSTTEAGPGGEGEGACAFVSDEEVERYLGEVPEVDLVEDYTDDAPVPYTYCEWALPHGPMIGVTLLEGTDRFDGRREYVGTDDAQGVEDDPSDVEGLGTDAFVVQVADDPAGFQVGVRLEDQTLEVTVTPAEGGTAEHALTLTQAVLQRI